MTAWQAAAVIAVTTICIVTPAIVFLLIREKNSRKADRENQAACHAFQKGVADQTSKAFMEVVKVLDRTIDVLSRVENQLKSPPTCANFQKAPPNIS